MANENPEQRIYQQIEETSDYYEPAIYELLTFYSALENQPDELDGQFLPLTTVPKRSPNDVKIMAFGLLPPSSNITGRLLDRSASVAALTGSSLTGNSNGVQNLDATSLRDRVVQIALKAVGLNATTRAQELEDFLGGPGESDETKKGMALAPNSSTCGLTVRAILREAGFQDSQYYPPYQNASAISSLYSYAVTHGAWVEAGPDKFPQPGDIVMLDVDQPDGHVFTVTSADPNSMTIHSVDGGVVDNNNHQAIDTRTQSWKVNHGTGSKLGDSIAGVFGIPPDGSITDTNTGGGSFTIPGGKSHRVNGWVDIDLLAAAEAQARASGKTVDAGAITGDAGSGDWSTDGSKNAGEAGKTASQTADRNLNQTGLGREFQAAQAAMIQALRAALNQMALTPPLRMLVNPSSFKFDPEKIIAQGSWGRNGPIIEHWGENQDKLEMSGKLAAFYSMDVVGGGPNNGDPGNGPGLGRTARQYSASYQNFLSLWLLYKNNGGIWFPDLIDSNLSKATNLQLVGSVYVFYDDTLYIGSFDSLNISEEEGVPFSLTYDISFTVRAWFLLDRVSDPTLTYGAPQFFNGNPVNPPQTTQTPSVSPFTPSSPAQPAPDVALPPSVTRGLA